ncbi:titin homolog [Prorops nasuta]|uniref:titin homolog n=1 Tax=Prorops nasuta TaxID=863751 RepID=UPI0034CFA976
MSGSGYRGNSFGPRGANPARPSPPFNGSRFPNPKYNVPQYRWSHNGQAPYPNAQLSRGFRGNGSYQHSIRGRGRNEHGGIRFSGPGRPPFRHNMYRGRPPIRPRGPIPNRFSEDNICGPPPVPLLGSEEERQKKIVDTVDKLRQKLSSITEEEITNYWQVDLSTSPRIEEQAVDKGNCVSELIHESPELNLTFGDLRDIGRIDTEYNLKSDKSENSQESIGNQEKHIDFGKDNNRAISAVSLSHDKESLETKETAERNQEANLDDNEDRIVSLKVVANADIIFDPSLDESQTSPNSDKNLPCPTIANKLHDNVEDNQSSLKSKWSISGCESNNHSKGPRLHNSTNIIPLNSTQIEKKDSIVEAPLHVPPAFDPRRQPPMIIGVPQVTQNDATTIPPYSYGPTPCVGLQEVQPSHCQGMITMNMMNPIPNMGVGPMSFSCPRMPSFVPPPMQMGFSTSLPCVLPEMVQKVVPRNLEIPLPPPSIVNEEVSNVSDKDNRGLNMSDELEDMQEALKFANQVMSMTNDEPSDSASLTSTKDKATDVQSLSLRKTKERSDREIQVKEPCELESEEAMDNHASKSKLLIKLNKLKKISVSDKTFVNKEETEQQKKAAVKMKILEEILGTSSKSDPSSSVVEEKLVAQDPKKSEIELNSQSSIGDENSKALQVNTQVFEEKGKSGLPNIAPCFTTVDQTQFVSQIVSQILGDNKRLETEHKLTSSSIDSNQLILQKKSTATCQDLTTDITSSILFAKAETPEDSKAQSIPFLKGTRIVEDKVIKANIISDDQKKFSESKPQLQDSSATDFRGGKRVPAAVLENEEASSSNQPESPGSRMKKCSKQSESSWKNRVISKFLKMSKNDICNMVNNSSLRKFDIAMKHLVKERKPSMSMKLRSTEDEKIKLYDREEFMNQLNAMLDPGAVVDINNLPAEFIHHLNEVLQLDVSPQETNEHYFAATPASETREKVSSGETSGRGSFAQRVNEPAASVVPGKSMTDTANSYSTVHRAPQMSSKSRQEKVPQKVRKVKKVAVKRINLLKARLEQEENLTDSDKDDFESSSSNNKGLFDDADLDDIMSAALANARTGARASLEDSGGTYLISKTRSPIKRHELATPDVIRRTTIDLDEIFSSGIARAKGQHRSQESDRTRALDLVLEKDWTRVEKVQRWRRKQHPVSPDAFRNLTKEEWMARHGIPQDKTWEGRLSNYEGWEEDEVEDNERNFATRQAVINSDGHESNGIKYNNNPRMTRSETDTDDDSSRSESEKVSKLLKMIKEKEKIAKQLSLNETIRDEVTAEIERAWREKNKKKIHKCKRREKRKKERRERFRKEHRRRRREAWTDNSDADSDYGVPLRLLREDEIKKEVIVKEEEPETSNNQSAAAKLLIPEKASSASQKSSTSDQHAIISQQSTSTLKNPITQTTQTQKEVVSQKTLRTPNLKLVEPKVQPKVESKNLKAGETCIPETKHVRSVKFVNTEVKNLKPIEATNLDQKALKPAKLANVELKGVKVIDPGSPEMKNLKLTKVNNVELKSFKPLEANSPETDKFKFPNFNITNTSNAKFVRVVKIIPKAVENKDVPQTEKSVATVQSNKLPENSTLQSTKILESRVLDISGVQSAEQPHPSSSENSIPQSSKLPEVGISETSKTEIFSKGSKQPQENSAEVSKADTVVPEISTKQTKKKATKLIRNRKAPKNSPSSVVEKTDVPEKAKVTIKQDVILDKNVSFTTHNTKENLEEKKDVPLETIEKNLSSKRRATMKVKARAASAIDKGCLIEDTVDSSSLKKEKESSNETLERNERCQIGNKSVISVKPTKLININPRVIMEPSLKIDNNVERVKEIDKHSGLSTTEEKETDDKAIESDTKTILQSTKDNPTLAQSLALKDNKTADSKIITYSPTLTKTEVPLEVDEERTGTLCEDELELTNESSIEDSQELSKSSTGNIVKNENQRVDEVLICNSTEERVEKDEREKESISDDKAGEAMNEDNGGKGSLDSAMDSEKPEVIVSPKSPVENVINEKEPEGKRSLAAPIDNLISEEDSGMKESLNEPVVNLIDRKETEKKESLTDPIINLMKVKELEVKTKIVDVTTFNTVDEAESDKKKSLINPINNMINEEESAGKEVLTDPIDNVEDVEESAGKKSLDDSIEAIMDNEYESIIDKESKMVEEESLNCSMSDETEKRKVEREALTHADVFLTAVDSTSNDNTRGSPDKNDENYLDSLIISPTVLELPAIENPVTQDISDKDPLLLNEHTVIEDEKSVSIESSVESFLNSESLKPSAAKTLEDSSKSEDDPTVGQIILTRSNFDSPESSCSPFKGYSAAEKVLVCPQTLLLRTTIKQSLISNQVSYQENYPSTWFKQKLDFDGRNEFSGNSVEEGVSNVDNDENVNEVPEFLENDERETGGFNFLQDDEKLKKEAFCKLTRLDVNDILCPSVCMLSCRETFDDDDEPFVVRNEYAQDKLIDNGTSNYPQVAIKIGEATEHPLKSQVREKSVQNKRVDIAACVDSQKNPDLPIQSSSSYKHISKTITNEFLLNDSKNTVPSKDDTNIGATVECKDAVRTAERILTMESLEVQSKNSKIRGEGKVHSVSSHGTSVDNVPKKLPIRTKAALKELTDIPLQNLNQETSQDVIEHKRRKARVLDSDSTESADELDDRSTKDVSSLGSLPEKISNLSENDHYDKLSIPRMQEASVPRTKVTKELDGTSEKQITEVLKEDDSRQKQEQSVKEVTEKRPENTESLKNTNSLRKDQSGKTKELNETNLKEVENTNSLIDIGSIAKSKKKKKKKRSDLHGVKDKRKMKSKPEKSLTDSVNGKVVKEIISSDMVIVKSASQTRSEVMARMIEIDLAIHKLVTEKMALYEQLQKFDADNNASTEKLHENVAEIEIQNMSKQKILENHNTPNSDGSLNVSHQNVDEKPPERVKAIVKEPKGSKTPSLEDVANDFEHKRPKTPSLEDPAKLSEEIEDKPTDKPKAIIQERKRSKTPSLEELAKASEPKKDNEKTDRLKALIKERKRPKTPSCEDINKVSEHDVDKQSDRVKTIIKQPKGSKTPSLEDTMHALDQNANDKNAEKLKAIIKEHKRSKTPSLEESIKVSEPKKDDEKSDKLKAVIKERKRPKTPNFEDVSKVSEHDVEKQSDRVKTIIKQRKKSKTPSLEDTTNVLVQNANDKNAEKPKAIIKERKRSKTPSLEESVKVSEPKKDDEKSDKLKPVIKERKRPKTPNIEDVSKISEHNVEKQSDRMKTIIKQRKGSKTPSLEDSTKILEHNFAKHPEKHKSISKERKRSKTPSLDDVTKPSEHNLDEKSTDRFKSMVKERKRRKSLALDDLTEDQIDSFKQRKRVKEEKAVKFEDSRFLADKKRHKKSLGDKSLKKERKMPVIVLKEKDVVNDINNIFNKHRSNLKKNSKIHKPMDIQDSRSATDQSKFKSKETKASKSSDFHQSKVSVDQSKNKSKESKINKPVDSHSTQSVGEQQKNKNTPETKVNKPSSLHTNFEKSKSKPDTKAGKSLEDQVKSKSKDAKNHKLVDVRASPIEQNKTKNRQDAKLQKSTEVSLTQITIEGKTKVQSGPNLKSLQVSLVDQLKPKNEAEAKSPTSIDAKETQPKITQDTKTQDKSMKTDSSVSESNRPESRQEIKISTVLEDEELKPKSELSGELNKSEMEVLETRTETETKNNDEGGTESPIARFKNKQHKLMIYSDESTMDETHLKTTENSEENKTNRQSGLALLEEIVKKDEAILRKKKAQAQRDRKKQLARTLESPDGLSSEEEIESFNTLYTKKLNVKQSLPNMQETDKKLSTVESEHVSKHLTDVIDAVAKKRVSNLYERPGESSKSNTDDDTNIASSSGLGAKVTLKNEVERLDKSDRNEVLSPIFVDVMNQEFTVSDSCIESPVPEKPKEDTNNNQRDSEPDKEQSSSKQSELIEGKVDNISALDNKNGHDEHKLPQEASKELLPSSEETKTSGENGENESVLNIDKQTNNSANNTNIIKIPDVAGMTVESIENVGNDSLLTKAKNLDVSNVIDSTGEKLLIHNESSKLLETPNIDAVLLEVNADIDLVINEESEDNGEDSLPTAKPTNEIKHSRSEYSQIYKCRSDSSSSEAEDEIEITKRKKDKKQTGNNIQDEVVDAENRTLNNESPKIPDLLQNSEEAKKNEQEKIIHLGKDTDDSEGNESIIIEEAQSQEPPVLELEESHKKEEEDAKEMVMKTGKLLQNKDEMIDLTKKRGKKQQSPRKRLGKVGRKDEIQSSQSSRDEMLEKRVVRRKKNTRGPVRRSTRNSEDSTRRLESATSSSRSGSSTPAVEEDAEKAISDNKKNIIDFKLSSNINRKLLIREGYDSSSTDLPISDESTPSSRPLSASSVGSRALTSSSTDSRPTSAGSLSSAPSRKRKLHSRQDMMSCKVVLVDVLDSHPQPKVIKQISTTPAVEEMLTGNSQGPPKDHNVKTQYTVHKGPILDIKVFGDSFLAASEDGSIYRYSQTSNGILNIYKGHKAAVTCLHIYSSSVDLIYSGSLDGTLRSYEITSGMQAINPTEVRSPIQCMDEAWGIIFIGTKAGHVVRFHIKGNTIKGESIHFSERSVLALKATVEGPRRVLIVASRSQPITIRDAQTGLFLRTIASQTSHTVYSLMRHNSFIYCGTSSTLIPVFDFTTGEQIKQYSAGVGIVCMRLHKKLLFAGCYDGNIYVFDTRNHELVCSISGPGNMLLSMEIVGNKIIAGSKDKRLHAWLMPKVVCELLSEVA